MATNEIKTRFKHAYKTESEWSSLNPVLYAGEIAYSSDKNNKYKVGNGTSTWSELSYVLPTKSDVGLGNVGNFKAVSTVASQGLSNTEKSNARSNIGAGTSSFSGSYNDLTNKPTIPSVGNGTVTIKQAGASKGMFTMNQSGNTTIELSDNNTTYGVATSSALGLVKSGTDITVDSSGNVSVNDDSHNHVIGNVDGLQSALNSKAVIQTLTSENLNNITTPGFYNAGGSNSVTNKPSGVDAFGLEVIHNASGNYYTQIIYMNSQSTSYRRYCINGTWGSWAQDKLTDTNTWRGIQNNLTSDSTSDSLSAAQGKALKTLIDGSTISQSDIDAIFV